MGLYAYKLGEILIARGVITKAQLTQALETQRINERDDGKLLEDTLRAMGVSSELITSALSQELGFPLIRHPVGVNLTEKILVAIPPYLARRHQVIPVALTDSDITVAMVDPLDIEAIDDIRLLTGLNVKVSITTPEDFKMAIGDYSKAQMRQAVSVRIVGKGFEKADYQTVMRDEITFSHIVRNTSGKDIRGFRGTIVFKDIFGAEVKSIKLSYDEGLKTGEEKTWDGVVEYNPFMDEDRKLRGTSLKNLQIEWNPHTILFTDGTKFGE